jgi:hypothetical protein
MTLDSATSKLSAAVDRALAEGAPSQAAKPSVSRQAKAAPQQHKVAEKAATSTDQNRALAKPTPSPTSHKADQQQKTIQANVSSLKPTTQSQLREVKKNRTLISYESKSGEGDLLGKTEKSDELNLKKGRWTGSLTTGEKLTSYKVNHKGFLPYGPDFKRDTTATAGINIGLYENAQKIAFGYSANPSSVEKGDSNLNPVTRAIHAAKNALGNHVPKIRVYGETKRLADVNLGVAGKHSRSLLDGKPSEYSGAIGVDANVRWNAAFGIEVFTKKREWKAGPSLEAKTGFGTGFGTSTSTRLVKKPFPGLPLSVWVNFPEASVAAKLSVAENREKKVDTSAPPVQAGGLGKDAQVSKDVSGLLTQQQGGKGQLVIKTPSNLIMNDGIEGVERPATVLATGGDNGKTWKNRNLLDTVFAGRYVTLADQVKFMNEVAKQSGGPYNMQPITEDWLRAQNPDKVRELYIDEEKKKMTPVISEQNLNTGYALNRTTRKFERVKLVD